MINARIMNRTFISNLEPRKDNYEILTFTSEKIMCPSLPDFSNHTVGIYPRVFEKFHGKTEVY